MLLVVAGCSFQHGVVGLGGGGGGDGGTGDAPTADTHGTGSGSDGTGSNCTSHVLPPVVNVGPPTS